jgi:superfamily II DNA or RNA helicase
LVQVGNIELRGSIGRQRDLDGISWKSSARWRHTATAEAQKEEEEEETEQNPQEPDDEAPSSTLPSSTVDLKTPISLPSPTSQTPVEEDETIHVLRAQYDLPAYLRPYQVQVIDACMKALARGVKRIGVSCPTGSGKTVIL